MTENGQNLQNENFPKKRAWSELIPLKGALPHFFFYSVYQKVGKKGVGRVDSPLIGTIGNPVLSFLDGDA